MEDGNLKHGVHNFLVGGLLALVAFAVLGTVDIARRMSSPQAGTAPLTQQIENNYRGIPVTATAAIVVDLTTGEVLYEREADRQLPLASLTKLMSSIIVSELLDGEAVVLVRTEDLAGEGDSGLRPGSELTVTTLKHYALVASSNDAALALAEAASATLRARSENSVETTDFVTLMNKRAEELGLAQTYFINETGLDRGGVVSGAYGSARDVATLIAYAAERVPELDATRSTAIDVQNGSVAAHLTNTNEALFALPGLVASKTGYTELAGGNLAVVADAGLMHPVAIVVLGSTYEERFTDVVRLWEGTLKALSFNAH